MAEFSTINVWASQKIQGNIIIDAFSQGGDYVPSNKLETGDLTAAPEEMWKNIARCKDATHEQQTQTDPEDSTDETTGTRYQSENVTVTGHTWRFSLERYTVFMDAMYQGVKDPLSDETAEKLSAGGKYMPYESNSPYVPVALRLKFTDANGTLWKTMYMYGNLRADGSQTFDGKIIRPQLVFEFEPSVHTASINEARLTGQSEIA